MKSKRIIAIVTACSLMLTLLTACGSNAELEELKKQNEELKARLGEDTDVTESTATNTGLPSEYFADSYNADLEWKIQSINDAREETPEEVVEEATVPDLPDIPVIPANLLEYKANDELGGIEIIKYFGTDTELNFPDSIDGQPVVKISENAFPKGTTAIIFPDSVKAYGGVGDARSTVTFIKLSAGVESVGGQLFTKCTALTDLVIPNGVKEIEISFSYCNNLRSVVIPDSVTSIHSAFYRCTNLSKVKLSSNLTDMYGAFSGCSSLKTLALPEGVTNIESAFEDCISLKNIVIPKSVTQIDSSAFKGCTNLENVIIPDSVTLIDWSAFEGCTKLENVIIPDSVTQIGGSAFKGCTNLKSVTIPDSVTAIGYGAFIDTAITEVTIPASLTDFNASAFPEKALNSYLQNGFIIVNNILVGYIGDSEDLVIPDGVTKVTADFSSRDSGIIIRSVVIPESVTEINGFAGNDDLRSVIINGPCDIPGCAFYYCTSLTSVTISDKVTSIGERAFSNCSSLKMENVIINGNPKIAEDAFEDCYEEPEPEPDLWREFLAL